MVVHNALQKIEPQKRELGEDPALFGNTCGQNAVKSGDPVRGDQEQMSIQVVQVADLTAGMKRKLWKVGLQNNSI
jgi:hypothetical protein